MPTTDTERYVRVTLLTHDVGIWISKQVLRREVDATEESQSLATLLDSKKQQLLEMKGRREITKKQYALIFPVSGTDIDIDNWDLSLLIKVVILLFGQVLSDQDRSDLRDILDIRNRVCHSVHPSLRENDFNVYWTKLAMCIGSIASKFDLATKERASDMVHRMSAGPLDLQSSVDKLSEICRNDEQMDIMLQKMTRIDRGLNDVRYGVERVDRKIDSMCADIQKLLRIHEWNDQGNCRVEIPILNNTVCLTGSKQDVVKLAEDILLKVLQSAINKVDDPNNNADVERAVHTFLADLESKGGVAESAEHGSINLKIRCYTLTSLNRMLRVFRGGRYRLFKIERALRRMLPDAVTVELIMPDETITMLSRWIKNLIQEDENQRNISLGIQCDTSASADGVVQYLQSSDSDDRLNQIAEALSSAVGDKIKISIVPDVEGFSYALSGRLLDDTGREPSHFFKRQQLGQIESSRSMRATMATASSKDSTFQRPYEWVGSPGDVARSNLYTKRSSSGDTIRPTYRVVQDKTGASTLTSSQLGLHFNIILDRFDTLDAVTREIKSVVDVDCGLIFGIDYTLSNRVQGQNTFGGKNLHDTSKGVVNPYQEVICVLGETLEPLGDDGFIPAFGFGDRNCKAEGIFPLKKQGECEGFLEVLDVYTKVTRETTLGGPTNVAPLIDEALKIVKKKKMYHILVIVADGQVTEEQDTVAAIVAATDYPLSIVVVGVGDGPWEQHRDFDDKQPARRFDNFQFAEFAEAKRMRNPEAALALAALMEVPDQYKAIQRLELLRKLQVGEGD